MRILMTGGTGFIGAALCARLGAAGREIVVLTRQAGVAPPRGASAVISRLDELDARHIDAVVNLAGASIAEGRWTEDRKRLLYASRLETTAKLLQWMRHRARPPAVLVSASAVGYYGEQGDRPVTEQTPPAGGFTHDLCEAWEREARAASSIGVRVCIMRIGVVLDRGGGAMARMLPAFRLGAGGRLGSGGQYFPWIHRDDVTAACQWMLDNASARDAYNVSAPNPVTNAEFTAALARALRRPALVPMPAAALKMLFGEMSDLLLVSDRMVPKRLLDEGFRFRFPDLDPALAEICRR